MSLATKVTSTPPAIGNSFLVPLKPQVLDIDPGNPRAMPDDG
jgi:hypothetical protein